jgi:hypothetical protein
MAELPRPWTGLDVHACGPPVAQFTPQRLHGRLHGAQAELDARLALQVLAGHIGIASVASHALS